ncbi:hypothetical protein GCM10011611_10800 [Aliidongia dinghuensis]|uniref:Uncharacterized protein n=2 Tax=Aliidongia dinghuensis TaxID=1867774 RepID=A0A8J3E120_9PROT|nr:hypothetical protein GCM10011611_10800 [Aliidongia dinghuensis]
MPMLLLWTFVCIIPIAGLIKLALAAILKPAQTMILVPMIAMAILFVPIFSWLLANFWRGLVILHADRIVYGPWPWTRTIRRDELEGFRVGAKPIPLLVLIPKGKPRDAFVLSVHQLGKDDRFWHWFETLGDTK